MMMDIWDAKNVTPMLIADSQEAFDSPDYIFELKLDGVRCLAYLDPRSGVELRNKRNLRVTHLYPELHSIHKQVKKRCILDGELIVMKEGRPDFYEMQRRALMSNNTRISFAAAKLPVSFSAFDIVYLDNASVTDLPLMERKTLLQKTVREDERLSIARYIPEKGSQLYELTVRQELEGVVAKRKDSRYYFGKRTKDWVKIKNLMDDDFVVCGYIPKENHVVSIILGSYDADGTLRNRGHVTLGVSSEQFERIRKMERLTTPLFPNETDGAVWIKPEYVCTVEYMMPTQGGGLRQPVFKGLRDDKAPEECTWKKY